MFCPSCGKEINGNEKFCGHCGYVIEKTSQTIPNTPKKDDNVPGFFEKKAIARQLKLDEKKENKKKLKSEKKAARKKHRKETHFALKLVVSLVLIISVLVGTTMALIYFNIVNIPTISEVLTGKSNEDSNTSEPSNNNSEESYEVPTVDANDYFENNSSIISKTKVEDSESVRTETDIKESFADRGFDSVIIFKYSMDGEYKEPKEVSESSEKHPEYETSYIANENYYWTIYDINGCIMAYPNSYYFESGKSVILSEKDTIMSYDSATNMFFETKPNDVAIIKVDRINVETLNSFNAEKIEEMLLWE